MIGIFTPTSKGMTQVGKDMTQEDWDIWCGLTVTVHTFVRYNHAHQLDSRVMARLTFLKGGIKRLQIYHGKK